MARGPCPSYASTSTRKQPVDITQQPAGASRGRDEECITRPRASGYLGLGLPPAWA
jgi:hypothetical protein